MAEDMFFNPHPQERERSQENNTEEKKEFSAEEEEKFKKELLEKVGPYDEFLKLLAEEKKKEEEEKKVRAKKEEKKEEEETDVKNKEKKYVPPFFKLVEYEFDKILIMRPHEDKVEKYLENLIEEKLKSKKIDYGDELNLLNYLKEKFKGSERIIDKISAKYGINMTSEEERFKLRDKIRADILHSNDELKQFNMAYSNDIINPDNESETRRVIEKILSMGINKYRLPMEQKIFIKELRKINSAEKAYFNKFVDKILEEKDNELKNI